MGPREPFQTNLPSLSLVWVKLLETDHLTETQDMRMRGRDTVTKTVPNKRKELPKE